MTETVAVLVGILVASLVVLYLVSWTIGHAWADGLKAGLPRKPSGAVSREVAPLAADVAALKTEVAELQAAMDDLRTDSNLTLEERLAEVVEQAKEPSLHLADDRDA